MWSPERYAPVRAFFPEGSRRHALLKFFYSFVCYNVAGRIFSNQSNY